MLVVLYIMTPLDVILTWLPILGRARASLRKIEALDPVARAATEADAAAGAGPRRVGLRSSSLELAGRDLRLPAREPTPAASRSGRST